MCWRRLRTAVGALLLAVVASTAFSQATPLPARSSPAADSVPLDFLVVLKRGACLGHCPNYEVAVGADGIVTWDGYGDVRRMGRRIARVKPKTIAKLAAAAVRVQRLGVQDSYGFIIGPDGQRLASIVDASASWVTIRANGRINAIEIVADAPRALIEFEELVDRLAGTSRWK
ncbi:MAG TPA: DUF6438 domain-containing protein [Vicinamibacterales bacterium]|nr:DUF6438 domain-containing protein [Vicinamibacterales bacterium]